MAISPGVQASLLFDPDAPEADVSAGARLRAWTPDEWPVAPDWRPIVDTFLTSEAGQRLATFVKERLAAGAIIYPPQPFRALALTPLSQVKVLILGQDPYHGPGQGEGLAFSVAPGVKLPPSLRNIFKEVARDPLLQPGMDMPSNGSLVRWAEQGVLLLNTCLTVEDGQPASHAQRGWEALTDAIVTAVARRPEPVVFMLWGAHAQTKQSLVDGTNARSIDQQDGHHLVLTANHPSPFSAMRPPKPFIGSGHFGLANAFLRQQGCEPIAW